VQQAQMFDVQQITRPITLDAGIIFALLTRFRRIWAEEKEADRINKLST
jgi:hypothetical protein